MHRATAINPCRCLLRVFVTSWQIVCAVPFAETPSAAPGQRPSPIEPLPEVPPHLAFVPADIADRLLQLASVTKDDVVYDLGCGDGRVAILAARKYGAKSVGVDVDLKRIADARANAESAGVSNLVRFTSPDGADLSDATVAVMTIPQSAAWLTRNTLLQPTLIGQLKPGARVVTNFVAGSMKEWKPDRVDRVIDAQGRARAILYLWIRPR
jgi:SAM-dependent methyltransferase